MYKQNQLQRYAPEPEVNVIAVVARRSNNIVEDIVL